MVRTTDQEMTTTERQFITHTSQEEAYFALKFCLAGAASDPICRTTPLHLGG